MIQLTKDFKFVIWSWYKKYSMSYHEIIMWMETFLSLNEATYDTSQQWKLQLNIYN